VFIIASVMVSEAVFFDFEADDVLFEAAIWVVEDDIVTAEHDMMLLRMIVRIFMLIQWILRVCCGCSCCYIFC
jgi:hypothetical protein